MWHFERGAGEKTVAAEKRQGGSASITSKAGTLPDRSNYFANRLPPGNLIAHTYETALSPFRYVASGQVPMRKVEVWVDGVKKYQSLYGFSHYAFLDAGIPLSSGTHAIAVLAAGWD